MSHRQDRPKQHGFTLVEVLITLAIGAVLMALAVPSMQGMLARKRLEAAGTELVTDLRYMRSAKLANGGTVSIRFSTTDAKSCYVIYVEGLNPFAKCNCSSNPVCNDVESAAEPLKVVAYPRSDGVELRSSLEKLSLVGIEALPANGRTLQVAVLGKSGNEVAVSTNELARPSICSVSGYENSLPRCTR